MKIIAFAGSNSLQSINKKLVNYAATLLPQHEVETLDIKDYELPIYAIDRERMEGIHDNALKFAAKIDEADAILLSLAEHNGSYTAVFKNLFDWISRIPNRKAWAEKPMFLMATSTGARGGLGVLEAAINRFPRNGGVVVDSFSLPSFNDTFSTEQGIVVEELKIELIQKLDKCFNSAQ
jgi:NAD(P)H-dependent FMN reductase